MGKNDEYSLGVTVDCHPQLILGVMLVAGPL